MNRRLRCFAAGSLLALLPVAASAQNLVANGGFSAALDSWRATGNGTASHSPDDIDGNPASGSALLRNARVEAGTRIYPLDQCAVLIGPGEYRIGANARVDPAQVDGRAAVHFVAYDGIDCTGTTRGGLILLISRDSVWTAFSFLTTIDTARSMLIRLGVDKPGAGGMLEVQVDDVFVERTPLIFRSGFE